MEFIIPPWYNGIWMFSWGCFHGNSNGIMEYGWNLLEFPVPWAKLLQRDVAFPHFLVCLQEAKGGWWVGLKIMGHVLNPPVNHYVPNKNETC